MNNVSAGVSAVVQSLPLNPGDEVLSTDHTYGAVSSALDRLCARTGATRVIAKVPIDSTDEEVVAVFAAHCSERTALVVIDQVTSPTARRFPIEAVAALAHRFGAAALVDAAHAPGMLPLEVPKLGADFWVGNLHKWACAPAGTGALWVASPWQRQMLALVVSWAEAEGFPLSFERVGTDDLSAWVAAPGSLHLLASLGWDRLRAHNEALVRAGQATVAEMLGSPPGELRHDAGLSMTLVPLPPGLADSREQTQAIKAEMAKRGVESRSAAGTAAGASGSRPRPTTARPITNGWAWGSATCWPAEVPPCDAPPAASGRKRRRFVAHPERCVRPTELAH